MHIAWLAGTWRILHWWWRRKTATMLTRRGSFVFSKRLLLRLHIPMFLYLTLPQSQISFVLCEIETTCQSGCPHYIQVMTPGSVLILTCQSTLKFWRTETRRLNLSVNSKLYSSCLIFLMGRLLQGTSVNWSLAIIDWINSSVLKVRVMH